MIGLGYMVFMVVFDIFGIVIELIDGYVLGVYVFMLIVILFIVFSYGKMVKVFFGVGFFYIYV